MHYNMDLSNTFATIPELYVPPGKSGRQKGTTIQLPSWGFTSITRYRTKFRRHGDWRPGFMLIDLSPVWIFLSVRVIAYRTRNKRCNTVRDLKQ